MQAAQKLYTEERGWKKRKMSGQKDLNASLYESEAKLYSGSQKGLMCFARLKSDSVLKISNGHKLIGITFNIFRANFHDRFQ